MGICLTAMQYLDLMNTFGTGSALISRREKFKEAANAAFVISVALSILLLIGGYLAAPAIAQFFNEPRFVPLFRVLILTLPIVAVDLVPHSILTRDLRFKGLLIPTLGKAVLKGGVSIILALRGYGVWSLVWGQVLGSIAAMVGSWLLAGWRPTRDYDREIFNRMLSYGGHIMSVGFIGTLVLNVDYILVGRILGTTALGFYTLAYRIPELVIRSINLVVGKVAFPVLAKLQVDMGYLRQVYLNYLSYIAMVVIPAGVGLAVLSRPLIIFVYTDKWNASVQPMLWISLGITVSALGHIPGVLYKAIDRPDILNKLALIKLPITIGVLWVSTRWGIVGVAVGQMVMGVIKVLMDTAVAQRQIGISTAKTLQAVFPAFRGSLIMAVVLVPLMLLTSWSNPVTLVVSMLAGAGVYCISLIVFNRELLEDAWSVVKAVLPGNSVT